MNMKKYFYCFISVFMFCISCGHKEEVIKTEVIPQKPVTVTGLVQEVKPIYKYTGDNFRDPFVSLVSEGKSFYSPYLKSKGEVKIPNLNTLELKGIIKDKGTTIALFKTHNEAYILKNGKLYDMHNRIIPGFSGVIEDRKVIIKTKDDIIKEFKLFEINP